MVAEAEASLRQWLNLTLAAGAGLVVVGCLSQWWAASCWASKDRDVDIATLPHPPRRVPFIGDVVGIKLGKPVQSVLEQSRDLGPISARKVLRTLIVTVSGADLVGELSDESRFRKFVGLHLPPLRRIVGDALFTAEDGEPNWQLAHDILTPACTAKR